MKKKIKFILAIHCHQPVGNFDFVFEDSYQKSYLPLLSVVENHPKIKLTLHFSGILFEWIKDNHPDFIAKVRAMCERGQVEILGGGYYEPILTILNDYDKIGQLKKLASFVKSNFNTSAKGMWMTERVWEPYLAKPIVEAGQEYIFLDDHHFLRAGVSAEQLKGYFITEEQGSILKVLPGSEALRYLMPFHPPEETIDYLKKLHYEMDVQYIAMADDGEKFGVWPGTHKLVYEEGWLDRFFTLIEENADWIEPSTGYEFVKNNNPSGLIYFPTCSYREMDEWVLPLHMNDRLERVVSGQVQIKEKSEMLQAGVWRNFLVKYPEANQLHKKMLYLSSSIARLRQLEESGGISGSKKAIRAAIEKMTDELWKSQCNDVYWHGIFGGLYLPHMRTALYESLIRAEIMLEEFAQKYLKSDIFPEYHNLPQVSVDDYNYDLMPEYKINTSNIFLYCDPQMGGTIYECNYKPASFNVMSTLARREEAYHKQLKAGLAGDGGGSGTIHGALKAKDTGLAEALVFDRYEKRSLMDIFLKPETTFDQYRLIGFEEISDFPYSPYSVRLNRKNGSLRLARESAVLHQMIRVTKEILPVARHNHFEINYKLQNLSGEEIETIFGVEFNINLLAGNAADRYFTIPGIELDDSKLASSGVVENISEVNMVDEWMKMHVHIATDTPFTLWRTPVETVSSSEGGLEKVYQASTLFPHWKVRLNPSDSFCFKILFAIKGT